MEIEMDEFKVFIGGLLTQAKGHAEYTPNEPFLFWGPGVEAAKEKDPVLYEKIMKVENSLKELDQYILARKENQNDDQG